MCLTKVKMHVLITVSTPSTILVGQFQSVFNWWDRKISNLREYIELFPFFASVLYYACSG